MWHKFRCQISNMTLRLVRTKLESPPLCTWFTILTHKIQHFLKIISTIPKNSWKIVDSTFYKIYIQHFETHISTFWKYIYIQHFYKPTSTNFVLNNFHLFRCIVVAVARGVCAGKWGGTGGWRRCLRVNARVEHVACGRQCETSAKRTNGSSGVGQKRWRSQDRDGLRQLAGEDCEEQGSGGAIGDSGDAE
jgi:hypothetical protein